MDKFLITHEQKKSLDNNLNLIFSDKAQIKSELQEGGAFFLVTAELSLAAYAIDVFILYDNTEKFLNSTLPPRSNEPRWMIIFNIEERMLYANVGGLV